MQTFEGYTEMSNSQSPKGVLALTPNCMAIDTGAQSHAIAILVFCEIGKSVDDIVSVEAWKTWIFKPF